MPRKEWPTGALILAASSSTASRASPAPTPVKKAGFSAPSIRSAKRAISDSAGLMIGRVTAMWLRQPSPSSLAPATSPGRTSTLTELFASADCIATWSRRGSWAGVETSSQKSLHSWKRNCGWVSWWYTVPISVVVM